MKESHLTINALPCSSQISDVQCVLKATRFIGGPPVGPVTILASALSNILRGFSGCSFVDSFGAVHVIFGGYVTPLAKEFRVD